MRDFPETSVGFLNQLGQRSCWALILACGLALVACSGNTASGPKQGSGGISGKASASAGGAGGSGGTAASTRASSGSDSTSGRDAGGPDTQGPPDAKSGEGGASSGGASTRATGSGGTGAATTGATGGATSRDAGAASDGGPGRDAGGGGGSSGSAGRDAGAGRTGSGGSAGRDVGTGGSADAGGSASDAQAAAPCQEPATIFPLPTSFGVPHATKALLACGVYVIGAAVVADAALLRAQQILQVALRKVSDDIPGVAAKLTASKSRMVILGKNEDQRVYWPDASGRRSFCSWPDRNGMIEDTTLEEELTSGQRSQLMTTVHETGHFTQFVLYLYNKSLYDRSVTAFNNCTKSLYNSYDLQDAQEFFAGDTLRWYDLNPSDLAVPNANTLSQRDQLKNHSATMYQIMSEAFYPAAIP